MKDTIWGWNDEDLDDDIVVDVNPIDNKPCFSLFLSLGFVPSWPNVPHWHYSLFLSSGFKDHMSLTAHRWADGHFDWWILSPGIHWHYSLFLSLGFEDHMSLTGHRWADGRFDRWLLSSCIWNTRLDLVPGSRRGVDARKRLRFIAQQKRHLEIEFFR